jgi:CDP-glucose 4,6-dehydratase
MEAMVVETDFWKSRRVLVTGHTGFKGAWLSLWLQKMGAEVYGYSLTPPTNPNLFCVAKVEDGLAGHMQANLLDRDGLASFVAATDPEIVFHLAAQALVRQSYRDPVETFATNVMGTVHLMEAIGRSDSVRVVVNVTTDKCYENREWDWGYRETDSLGGHDPYAASKACSELVSASYRQSFLAGKGIQIATARAGNVIGGGDWSPDRLVPDVLRAFDEGKPVTLRSPDAIRPWQHVLEPLAGYLMLAERLWNEGDAFAEGWNFGPAADDAESVEIVVRKISSLWDGKAEWSTDPSPQPHEAHYLRLDASKSRHRLGWAPCWNLDHALHQTLAWHQAWKSGADMRLVSLEQIADYVGAA